MKKIVLFTLLSMSCFSNVQSEERVITTSPYITQVVEALGKEKSLVGVDTTSRYNTYLKTLPDIGYRIALSTEGMLSLSPTLVLWSSDSGPVNVVEQVKGSGVASFTLKNPSNVDELKALVSEMGEILNVQDQSEVLNQSLQQKYDELQAATTNRGELTTLFLMEEMSGKGSKSFAGSDTSATDLIQLLGLKNPFADQFKSYKSVNIETQIQQGAEIVLLGKRKEYDEKHAPIIRRDVSVLGWPNAVAPKCVFEIDISHLLVYGVYLYDDAITLNKMLNECLEEVR